MGERNVTNYTLTSRAKQGFQRVGRFLHIEGMDNIVSFIIWNMLDITPVPVEDLEHAKESCLKRLNYVRTPERATVAISMSNETKLMFERMYVAAGIGSMSAALDLLGSSVVENGWADAEKYQFVNDFENPFYVYRKDNYVCFRAHNTEPLGKANAMLYDKDGVLAAEKLVMEPDGSISTEPDMSDSFRATITLEPETKQPAFKKISAFDENGKPCTVYVGKVSKEMLAAIEADKKGKPFVQGFRKHAPRVTINATQHSKNGITVIEAKDALKVDAIPVTVHKTGKQKTSGHRTTLQQLQKQRKDRVAAPGAVVADPGLAKEAMESARQMGKFVKKGGPIVAQAHKPNYRPGSKSNLGHLLGS
nr:hypothetical protein [uncultured Butyrivibrio sp.]